MRVLSSRLVRVGIALAIFLIFFPEDDSLERGCLICACL